MPLCAIAQHGTRIALSRLFSWGIRRFTVRFTTRSLTLIWSPVTAHRRPQMSKQKVVVQLTGTNSDALSGTDLERAPGPGLLEVWIASTVNTATVTCVLGGANIVRNQVVALRTNGVPNLSDDPPTISEAVTGGEKTVLNVGGTVGTAHILAVFTPLEDL